MMLILGVTTLDGDEEAELLLDIFTGVVDPETWVGDFGSEALFGKAVGNWDDRHDAHFHPDAMSLSLITGLWQSWQQLI